jgi:GntR family transcriptional regulator, transcriptional repressor for pyruvate dehydrogenase complex
MSVATPVHSDGDLANGGIVKPVKVARAYEQLAGLLRERITSGDLREGDRLPSETSLAEQAGVGRSTVREALRTLQEAGLIERASPRVMIVARRAEDPVFRELRHALRRRNVTFHHLHEALVTLEPELARFAAERADADDIRLLHEAVAAQERNLEHFHEWSRLDEEFHLSIAEMSGNPALIIARAPITQLLVPVLHQFIRSTTHTEHATGYHRRIVSEIEAGDPDTAAAVTRRHVNDFRTAWEKAGLDFHLEIADLGDDGPGAPNADKGALWDLQPPTS